MNKKLALLPLLLAQALTYAQNTDQAVQLQDTVVKGNNKALRSFSRTTEGELRDRVNLSLLGQQNAFTTPITVVNYDEKAFADKEPRNIVDALAKTDSSVMNFGGETNTLQGIYVRGLQLDARQMSVNGLAGLYSTYNSPTAAVASAQLIKGASTATNGMDPEGSSGASLNIETKRATDEPINKIGLTWLSSNRLQESVDFGRRFGENNEWGLRVNARYRNGETPRQNYDEEAYEAAIAADYRGEKLSAAIDVLSNQRATTGARARVQDMQKLNFQMPSAPDANHALNPKWLNQTTKDNTVMATAEYRTDAGITVSGGIGHMESRYDGAFAQIIMDEKTGAKGNFAINSARLMDYRTRSTSANFRVRGELTTGPVQHSWNTSFDLVKRHRDFDQGGASSFKTYNLYADNVFPTSGNLKAIKQGTTNETIESRSWALSDTLGFFNNSLRLTLGGRFQWIKSTQHETTGDKQYSANRFSPMLAVAYLPRKDLTLYGNYLEDLEPGGVDAETDTMIKPVVTKQIEVGVRKNWNDVVTTTLSAYQLKRPGSIRGDIDNAAYGITKAMAGEPYGEERNRGIEFNVYANLLDKTLRPSLGVTYNQGKLINFPTYADTIINGSQVSSPRVIAKAGVEWDVPTLQGLTLNTHIQHYGSSYQKADRSYSFPSYTTVDFGAKYAVKLGKNDLTLRGGVENAFNKNYWQVQRGRFERSFAVVGMPRTYWLKAEYSF